MNNKRTSDHLDKGDSQHQNKRAKTNENFDVLRNAAPNQKRLIYDVARDNARPLASDTKRPDRNTGRTQRTREDVMYLVRQRSILLKERQRLEHNEEPLRDRSAQLHATEENLNRRYSEINERIRQNAAESARFDHDRGQLDRGTERLESFQQHIHGEIEQSFAESTRAGRHTRPDISTPFTHVEHELASVLTAAHDEHWPEAERHATLQDQTEEEAQRLEDDNKIYEQHKNEHDQALNNHKEAGNAYNKALESHKREWNRFIEKE